MNPIVAKSITIKNIALRTEARRKCISKQYQVEFSVGDRSQITRKAKEKQNRTSWDENLLFNGNDGSAFVVKVFQKSLMGKVELVGTLTDTVGSISGKLVDNVLEVPISQGAPGPSGRTIRFTLDAAPFGQPKSGVRQTTEIVAGDAVGPLPSVGISTKMATKGRTFETTWVRLCKRMKQLHDIVTDVPQLHQCIFLALSVLSAANQLLVNKGVRDDRVIRLAGMMNDVLSFVDDDDPLREIKERIQTTTLLMQQVTECGYFMIEYVKSNSFTSRATKFATSEIDARITAYDSTLQDLKRAFSDVGLVVQTEIAVVRIMDELSELKQMVEYHALDDMPYAAGAKYSPEKGCLPGTRESLLRAIIDVLSDPDEDAPRVCLLTGVAGSGKSAVSHSIAQLYDAQKRLGSSYCFSRSDIASRNSQNLFSTIARNLSDHIPQYKSALWKIIKDDRALRTSVSPMEQLERFIVEPCKQLPTIGPVIIVIDALDECGLPDARRLLLSALTRLITNNPLPANFRFLITARPELDIVSALVTGSNLVHKKTGDVPQDDIDRDIRAYVHHSLHKYAELERSWPNQEWCSLLVHRSQHLFQWASTACKFIGDSGVGLGRSKRLKLLLQENQTTVHPLDELYRTILDQLFTFEEARQSFRNVMAIVLALKEPLSLVSLSTLFMSDEDLDVSEVIEPMGALLDGTVDKEQPIRTLHTSFHDYLLDETRSSIYHVDIQSRHHVLLGQVLLACMQEMLRFNICDLKDSRTLNKDIPDLSSRVRQAIPGHLVYSCQYWMDHLQYAPLDLLAEVTQFFKSFFPFWIEAISLLSFSSPGVFIQSATRTCTVLKKWAKNQEIAILASEAVQFLRVFAPVLQESTPHIYLSAMSQTPYSSPLCKLWADHLHAHISVTSEHPANWSSEVHVMQGQMSEFFLSVAYSPDGIHIASGSWDDTIKVWNANTGQSVAGPFQGHTDSVFSVAYSPDGANIVSGSLDQTLRVWNATTGELVADPFLGHTDAVLSVAYSPKGTHIASGSADETIMVWNATTGKCVAGPFEGHTDVILSVAWSPNKPHVVSGSADLTVRVWNVDTGKCVAGPFEGHRESVMCVAYSPDGTHIVSSSLDQTIKVWNATTGLSVGVQFKGHNHSVMSVAYSPDGIHIVSSSRDSTVRIWNATTGQCVAGPFHGHVDSVLSVAYSPDGAHIVSCSFDQTIRVWNAAIGQSATDSSQRQSNRVWAVGYSSKGTHMICGSEDKTIRMWDAVTRDPVMNQFQGHTDGVLSIAPSPDGNHIASSSWDHTIKIWNTSGQLVMDPLQWHGNRVSCVAYSPDGIHIASGSWETTIMIWNATTGQSVAGPFQGHMFPVCSIAYSPDGFYIVSGSGDKTLRIWDATTGESIMGPLQGHKDAVWSVAYSPNGNYIVSGSEDHTVRVWDATSSQSSAPPFQGHTDTVWSVAYSPDGVHVVSGSADRTIIVWNATTGQLVAGPFQGHKDDILSVAYSPDGSQIISGSCDGFIKVWKANLDNLLFYQDLSTKKGWIQSSNGACFGWIAPWNRRNFHLPIHSLVISSGKIYRSRTDKSIFGKSWVLCWAT